MRLTAPELIAIALIIILLFGAKRLPGTARAVGESLKIFKKSVRDDEDEKKAKPAVEPREITAAGQPVHEPVQPAAQQAPADETKRVQQ
jgi:sec-independent protein translocase protein TatA